MNKAELIKWLARRATMGIAPRRDRGTWRWRIGVNGEWSMRDIIAHLTGWQHGRVARLQAAAAGQPEPAPPWPADLKAEDEINGWIYTANRQQPVRHVLDETHALYEELLAICN